MTQMRQRHCLSLKHDLGDKVPLAELLEGLQLRD